MLRSHLPGWFDVNCFRVRRMSSQDLSTSVTSAGPGASSPTPPKWTFALPFVMQAQLQDEWCWAATSCSISHFYDGSSAFSQCIIVNNLLGESVCCTDGSSAECDKPWYLNRALTLTGNLVTAQQTFIAMAALQAELAAGHVVGVFVGWRGGGGHFLALSAVDVPASRVLVGDPLNGTSDYDLTAFTNNYRGAGEWNGTYMTHAPAGVMPLGGGPRAATVRETFDESATLLVETGPEQAVGTRLSAERAATYRVFVFGLDNAVSGNALAESTFAGYMTVVNSGVPSIIEVNLDALGNPTPPHHTRGRFVHSLVTQAIEMADARADADSPEIRYLKAPAIHLSALWAAFGNVKKDFVVPLSPAPSGLQTKRYSAAEFASAVSKVGRRRSALLNAHFGDVNA